MKNLRYSMIGPRWQSLFTLLLDSVVTVFLSETYGDIVTEYLLVNCASLLFKKKQQKQQSNQWADEFIFIVN